MAGSTAEISWVSNDQAVLRSFEKVERNLDNMARKLDKVEQASKKSAQTTQTGFAAAAKTLGDFATAVTGIGSVISGIAVAAAQVRAEWENLKNQQKAAADANLSLAQALPATVRSTGGFLTPQEVEEQIRRVSRNTLSGQVAAANAITEGLTARAPQNRKEVMDAIATVEATMKFAPEADSETLAAMAGGAVDLQKRYKVTPEQAVGFFEMAGGVGRVVRIRDQAQNMVPAIGGLTNFGATPAEAAALFGTITLDTGDFSGASARTASISLAKALSDRGYANPMEGIRALQADPELRKAFLYGGKFGGKTFGKAPIEAAQFPTIQALLTAGTQQAEMLAGAVPKVGDWEDAQAAFNRTASLATQTNSGRLAKISKAFRAGGEAMRLANIVGAEGSITREGYAELLAASGAGALEQSWLAAEFDLATGGGTRTRLSDLAAALRRRARALTATTQFVSSGVGGGGVEMPRRVSELESAQGATLKDVADLLQQLVNETKDQTNEMKSSPPTQRALPSAQLRR